MSSPPKGCRAPGSDTAQPVAKSKASRWRAFALIAVHVAFAIHLAFWLDDKRTISPIEPSEAMEFSKRSAINAGFVFFVLMILSTLVLGRFFCGWACHLVALQDLCAAAMRKLGIRPKPLRSKTLALVPFVAGFYLFLWPLVQRWWLGTLDHPVTLELETTAFWATFPGVVISILTFLFAGFAAVYFLGSKGFCTYACPYGAFFHTADRAAPLRIRVTDACEGCGHCTVACTSNVAVSVEVRRYGMVVDPGCMKCLDCVSVCPKDALYVGWGKPALAVRGKTRRAPRFRWGWELWLTATFLAAFFTFRGLYGRVPFLMTLAVAGCLAFLALRGAQMLLQPRVEIAPFVLKEKGRWTRAGRAFALLLLPVLAFWGHSAWIRFEDAQSRAAYQPLIPVRAAWFTNQRPEVTEQLRAQAEEVVALATRVIEQGLWETPRVRVERGWASMILGDEERFQQDLAIASALAPKDVNTLVERGHALRARGDARGAVPLYQQAVRRNADEVDTQRYLIDAAREAGDLSLAIQPLRRVTEERPWDAGSFERLALANAIGGRAREAEAALRKAVDLSPPGEGPWSRLMQFYSDNGRGDEAVQWLEKTIPQVPKLVELRAALVRVLLVLDRRSEAQDALSEALKVSPDDPQLRILQQTLQPN